MTNSNGLVDCPNLPPGTYVATETEQSGFLHTATCTDGACGTCSISGDPCANNSACHTGTCSNNAIMICTMDSDCPGGTCISTETCVPPSPINQSSITVVGNDLHHVDFGNVGLGTISGRKFDDLNGDGLQQNPPDAGLAGVKVTLTGTAVNGTAVSRCAVTDSSGNYSFSGLLPGTYAVTEVKPAVTIATNPTSCPSISLAADLTNGCTVAPQTCSPFGDACLGAAGGLTLGFWSNKNGQALITTSDLAFLTSLNLVNAKGIAFDPATKKSLANWLLSANATNMAYMLSAQLAAMELNTREPSSPHSSVNPSIYVLAGTPPAGCGLAVMPNINGFISVSDLMSDANILLGAYPNTVSSSPQRSCEEYVKNALDAANNNKNFDIPCPVFSATCP